MTDTPHLHVLFVSHQPMPSLVPVLVKEGADPCFPARAVLLVETPEMRERADRLEAAFRPRGVAVERWTLPAATDLERIRPALEQLFLELHEKYESRVAINVTGGTKLMALAAFSIAQELQWPVYYLDHETDRILWLHDKTQGSFPFTFQASIETVMAVHGYTVDGLSRQHPSLERRDAWNLLIERHETFAPVLPKFNALCQYAEGKLTIDVDNAVMTQNRGFKPLIDIFESAGVVRFNRGVLEFPNQECWQLAAGSWLEEFIFAQLAGLRGRGGLADVATGVNVTGPGGARNEIDVAFLAGHHLGLIECKARRIDHDKLEIGAAAISKLKTLGQAGGREADLFICSYLRLRESDYGRANQEGIKVIAGGQLARVRKLVIQEIADRQSRKA